MDLSDSTSCLVILTMLLPASNFQPFFSITVVKKVRISKNILVVLEGGRKGGGGHALTFVDFLFRCWKNRA